MNVRAFLLLFLLSSSSVWADLKTVPYVDPNLYLGTWYQIARNPLPFEQGCVCSRQVLSAEASGVIGVYNSCNSVTPDGALREIRGTATNDDPQTNARFTVDFGFPRKGQYWIIGLDKQYRYAVVSEPSLSSLYILSKTPTLAPELYAQAVKEAARQTDVSKLLMTVQEGCTYPAALMPAAVKIPAGAKHPGSKDYLFSFDKTEIQCAGRATSLYVPKGTKGKKFPVVIFGHGQALDVSNYEATFEHLAKKGIVAVFPGYDTGFFDQDWSRMGRDFVNVSACALTQIANRADLNKIVFAGHSKGAYVASIAAGLAFKENLTLKPKSVVLFEAAGFDQGSVSAIDPATAVTVVYSEADTIVGRDISDSIYRTLRSQKKQFIFLKNYADLKADHFWPLTRGSLFGGGAEDALDYHGGWKWLTAAAWDLRDGGAATNPYLYGALAADKGLPSLKDEIGRNW